jgi:hypothetical protein
MPFFLLPAWMLFAICGAVLLLVRRLRRVGIYTILISSAALLCAFVFSTLVVYAGMRILGPASPTWHEFTFFVMYVGAIGGGAVAGGLAGLFATRKLLGPR